MENKSSQLDNDNFRLSNASNLALLVSRQSIEEQAGIGMKRSDFRMNTAVLHKSGALLLEEKDSQDLDDKLHRIRSSTPSANLLRRLSGQILTPATSEHPQAQSQQVCSVNHLLNPHVMEFLQKFHDVRFQQVIH